jgi:hypothetical protein
MSINFRTMFCLLAGILSFGDLSPPSTALAQTPSPQTKAPSHVVPTGGGAALLDPSSAAILLLNHQSGLFRTVCVMFLALDTKLAGYKEPLRARSQMLQRRDPRDRACRSLTVSRNQQGS